MKKIVVAITLFNLSFCFAQKNIINKTFVGLVGESCKEKVYRNSSDSLISGGCTIFSYVELKFTGNQKVKIISYLTYSCYPKEFENSYSAQRDTTYSSYRFDGNAVIIKDFDYSPLKLIGSN